MNAFHKSHLEPWGRKLVEKYPLIFLDNPSLRNGYKIDPADFVSLRYGFEHDRGWEKLIDELADTATKLVTNLRSNGFPNVSITGFICKQKFGTLRWQGDANLPEPFYKLWQAYVGDIEQRSVCTCEITGEYGTLCARNGWMKTLCEEEAKKLGYTKCD